LIWTTLNRDTSHFLYERINIGGTATVVKAAVEAGVKRLVFFSTIAVYGNSNGQILNEETPAKPDTFYAIHNVINSSASENCPWIHGQG
jgi:nucleoside-diphosphate-sugar epimerase